MTFDDSVERAGRSLSITFFRYPQSVEMHLIRVRQAMASMTPRMPQVGEGFSPAETA